MARGVVNFADLIGPDGVRGLLDRIAAEGTPMTEGLVEFGDRFVIPRGLTYGDGARVLEILENNRLQELEPVDQSREFPYRMNDGAYAASIELKERFGIVIGKDTMFQRRQMRDVQISPTESVRVPWGTFEIPALGGATIQMCDGHRRRDLGSIFCLHFNAPPKYEPVITAFFDAVEERLRTGSIYRGKALIGRDDLEFLDLSTFDPSKVIYAEQVNRMLEVTLWSVLRHTDAMRRDGIPLKRAVLLHGPYGTGKTLTGQLTAKIATDNGWTFIAARPGYDDLEEVLATARLYQPAVVFFEDVDIATSTGEDNEVSQMLEAFDGIVAKGGELVVVMTTNHLERIHKGMLRPGRLDALVEVGHLDRAGTEKLIKAVTRPEKLDANIDYDAVHAAMDGFYPAFIREAVTRASSVALSGASGNEHYSIITENLVKAASSLRPQLQHMAEAKEGEKKSRMEDAFGGVVRGAFHGAKVLEGGRPIYEISANGTGHH